MKPVREALYFGTVGHARKRPVVHKLSYKVFSVLFDCNDLDGLARRLKLFSHNRFNIFSFYDTDYGDGSPLPDYLARISREAGVAGQNLQFSMLCYPRILGYAFNPLTVYFGRDATDTIRLVIYEVHNTFGENKTYVLPAHPNEDGLIWQTCAKELYVSPFNPVSGTYSFHVTPIGDNLTVGVALKDTSGPVLKAHFHGKREELTDTGLLWAVARTGFMTLKVYAGIHIEAAKLWFKGMRLVPRPKPPAKPVSYIKRPGQGPAS